MCTLGGAPAKGAIEPLEVFAHQSARQEVVGLDGLTSGVDHTAVADPAVAPPDGPVVQPDPIGRLVRLRLERVQRELPAGIVEEEVVRLRDVVDARARSSRLNDVDRHVNAGSQVLARECNYTFERAHSPWS